MKLIYNTYCLPCPAHIVSEDSCRMLGNHVTRVQLSNRGQLFGIFDGMGSLPRGGDAARYLGDQLIKFYDHIDQQPADALKALLIGANDTIAGWETPLNSQWTRAGGCAGTVALLIESRIILYHAGDTTALLLKDDYQSEEDYKVLTACHNSIHGGLTSFWGIGDNLIIDESQYPLEEDDILLLVTDGLTDVLTHKEIAEMVRQMDYSTPDECEKSCLKLCQIARKRGSLDDISVLLVYREE